VKPEQVKALVTRLIADGRESVMVPSWATANAIETELFSRGFKSACVKQWGTGYRVLFYGSWLGAKKKAAQ